MVNSLLWVALVAGTPGEPRSQTTAADFLALTAETVRDIEGSPAASPPAVPPARAGAVPNKETRSQEFEPSPGPVRRLDQGRTPSALQ